MDAGARRIVHFINDALKEAHTLVKRDVPDFHEFKRRMKNHVTGVEMSTDSGGNRTMSIGVVNGGSTVIEVVEPLLITPELRKEFRSLILDIFRHNHDQPHPGGQ